VLQQSVRGHVCHRADKHIFPGNTLDHLQLEGDGNGTQEPAHPLPFQLLSMQNYLREAWREETKSEYELIHRLCILTNNYHNYWSISNFFLLHSKGQFFQMHD